MSADRSPQVGTPANMRGLNQRAVLERLRTAGPATRPQIATDTGLSKPTVGQALLDLEQHGLVRTAGRTLAGPGRSAVVYEVDPSAGHVLGIDIGRGLIRVAVADLSGAVVARIDERNRARSASALMRIVHEGAENAFEQAGIRIGDVVSTVVGTPGVPDAGSATLQQAPNLPGWERKGLLKELESVLGTEMTVENDANLSAVGEHESGAARGVDASVCVTVGTGIGMGIILDGRLYRGAHGAAGEIGYLPFGWPSGGGMPDVDYAKQRQGMLESAAAAHSVVEHATRTGLTKIRTAKDVFEAARHGDEAALEVVEEEANRLAFVVSAVAAVIDPELVVVAGGIGKNHDLLAVPLERAMGRVTPMRPKIVPGELGEEAALTGAIATALRTARDVVFDRRGQAG
ncbi:ROK family transcriptional regulator [Amycolatopsis minnesotensis]|uniref:ROK family protein n=1 Tax=Amycolatopsis minnesotensis TaxID=337894 RepID=A0ABN2RKD5_9PSEU